MYEDKTQSVIRASILAAMGDSVSKLEGSFASDMAAAVALEIATAYAHIDYALLTYLLETNEGEYLERRAAEYGITRKSGTKATVTLTAAGTNGTVLPTNTQVLSEDGHVFLTDASATISGGVATVQATAAKIGAEYNVIAGSVTRFFKNIAGISSIANENAAVGGTDNESDEALRERVLFRLQMPATSGNAYHYQQWALEVDGIGAAKVLPLWNGNGTVKVIVASSAMGEINSETLAAVVDHIEAVRPIGADVTVVSAEAVTIDLAATVYISPDTTLAAVTAEWSEKVLDYLNDLAFDAASVSYNKLVFLLMSCAGVNDYASLTVNGGTSSILLSAEEIPALGTVTVNAAV